MEEEDLRFSGPQLLVDAAGPFGPPMVLLLLLLLPPSDADEELEQDDPGLAAAAAAVVAATGAKAMVDASEGISPGSS